MKNSCCSRCGKLFMNSGLAVMSVSTITGNLCGFGARPPESCAGLPGDRSASARRGDSSPVSDWYQYHLFRATSFRQRRVIAYGKEHPNTADGRRSCSFSAVLRCSSRHGRGNRDARDLWRRPQPANRLGLNRVHDDKIHIHKITPFHF